MELPWSPIFTVQRSGQPEVTVSGLLSVWDGDSRQLLAVGNQDATVWSRSLLKPWQILSLLPELKQAYHLKPHHLAMMLASHNGEPWQMDYLKEILMLGGLDESELKCPECYPMAPEVRVQLESTGARPKAIYNPCSGKHTAYLLAMKAKKQPTANYLEPDADQFELLKDLLCWLLNKDRSQLAETTDGCLLPNYGFTIAELARLYGALARELPSEKVATAPARLKPLIASWSELREVMIQYPKLIGGTERLDSKIMSGQVDRDRQLHMVAKEGADGLLGVGISPYSVYPKGLGILVKLASGYNAAYLETIIVALFERFGLRTSHGGEQPAHLKTEFHFTVANYQTA